MLNPYKSLLVGMGAGNVVWLVLFLPITTSLVKPAINSITTMLAIESQRAVVSDNINSSIKNIALIAIGFHLICGAVFGFIISSLLRIRLFRIKQHYTDIVNIDPNIRLVTICDADGKPIYSRHRQDVVNLLTLEESKKSLEMAKTGWKVRNELSHKIGRGRYVVAEYEKIKRITMPFGDDYLLYLTTEVQADHLNIINRIRKLASQVAEKWRSFHDGIYAKSQREEWQTAIADFMASHVGIPENPFPSDMNERVSGNIDFFFKHEYKTFVRYLPNGERIRNNNVSIVAAVGRDSNDAYYVLSTKMLANKLGCEILEFPGHHGASLFIPEEFSKAIRNTIERFYMS